MTQRCIYALKAILELASRAGSAPVKIQEIADAQQIPIRFLESILNELRRGGFVESRRGYIGGYLLARPAAELSVGEVIEFIEGPVELNFKVKTEDAPSRSSFALDKFWGLVAGNMKKVYDTTTFEDLAIWEQAADIKATNNYVI